MTKQQMKKYDSRIQLVTCFAIFLGTFWCCLVVVGSADVNAAQSDDQKSVEDKEDKLYKGVKWRCIGPFRGGRSVCASGVIGDSQTYFMGTTGGGLWKTDNAGQHWKNVSDGFFKTGSVGAVAVS